MRLFLLENPSSYISKKENDLIPVATFNIHSLVMSNVET